MESVARMAINEDIRQSEAYGKFLSDIGWRAIRTPRTKVQVFLRKLGPVALAKIQRSTRLPREDELKTIFKTNRVFMCKFEPSERISKNDLHRVQKLGFRLDNWPLLGTKTLRLDINKEPETLLSNFKKDARYCIRQAERNSQEISKNDYGLFYSLWKQAARNKKIWIPSEKEYNVLVKRFSQNCFSIIINKIAGCVVLINKSTAFYYYSAALPEAKEQQLPYLVIWEAIKEAKKRGCTIWDFEGIYDKRWPNKGWAGFSHFKKSFNGTEVEYPGSFVKWRWPF